MADLNALMVFAKVAEAGSFSEAARQLKMPVSTASRRIAELEDDLGIKLLQRSTRKLRLTEVGRELLDEAKRTLDISEAVRGIASNQMAEMRGSLRLTAVPNISDSILIPIVVAFQEAHPAVRVEVMISERNIDVIAERIDLAFHVGPLRDSSMVARRILRFRHQLVASPQYLARFPPPRMPAELNSHRILAFSHFRPEYRWSFDHIDGTRREEVSFSPFLGINDFTGVTAGLLAAAGVGELSPIVQPELLREGRLVEIMSDWHFPILDLSLVHPPGRHLSRQVRSFKDFATAMAPQLFPDLPT